VYASSLFAPVHVQRGHDVCADGGNSEILDAAIGGTHAALIGHFEILKADDGLPPFTFNGRNVVGLTLVAGGAGS
jgi:uncharacterized membrane protein